MTERPILFSAPMVRALLAGTKTQTRRVVKPQPPADTYTVGTYHHPDPRPHFWAWTDSPTRPECANLSEWCQPCPYGQPGDRLWVREAFAQEAPGGGIECVRYYRATPDICRFLGADGVWREQPTHSAPGRWTPSIHMPRAASRILLEITGVRVERLQDISEADAIAEGCKASPFPGPWWQGYRDMGDGDLIHQQAIGDAPPDWMLEPKRMKDHSHLDTSAADAFRALWWSINGVDSWAANPWVWVVEFKPLPAASHP